MESSGIFEESPYHKPFRTSLLNVPFFKCCHSRKWQDIVNLLSGQQCKSHFSFPTFFVKDTCIQLAPLLSGTVDTCWLLMFYYHFYRWKPVSNGHCKKNAWLFGPRFNRSGRHLSLPTDWPVDLPQVDLMNFRVEYVMPRSGRCLGREE